MGGGSQSSFAHCRSLQKCRLFLLLLLTSHSPRTLIVLLKLSMFYSDLYCIYSNSFEQRANRGGWQSWEEQQAYHCNGTLRLGVMNFNHNSAEGLFAFIMHGRISSITSNKENCRSFSMSWDIKATKMLYFGKKTQLLVQIELSVAMCWRCFLFNTLYAPLSVLLSIHSSPSAQQS